MVDHVFVGYALLLWPVVHGGITSAFSAAGTALWAIGDSREHGAAQRTIMDTAAVTGLITITLQIAYLPVLYAAFNHRETDVALLNARAGMPTWGPELLARSHYALGSGVSTVDTLPQLYGDWERWATHIGESHTTYPPLLRFRSPEPLSSWITALLAILDSAALFLALSPQHAPTVPARLCLRGGYVSLGKIAETMRCLPAEHQNAGGISLTYHEFVEGVAVMRDVDFPIERDPLHAWAGLRRLAGQLRGAGLRHRESTRRPAGAVVWIAAWQRRTHRTDPSAAVMISWGRDTCGRMRSRRHDLTGPAGVFIR